MRNKTSNIDLTKIHLKDLESNTENYVDQVFVEPVKILLSKNIICEVECFLFYYENLIIFSFINVICKSIYGYCL